MKAIYMVDVPKIGDCDSCPLYDIEDVMNGTRMVCLADKEEGEDCPLRPLPSKKETKGVIESTSEYQEKIYQNFHNRGFNACLDEILGDCITQEEADLCGVQLWHDD